MRQRDAVQRFLVGNQGKMDNRKRQQRALEILYSAVSDEDLAEIVKVAVRDARAGNHRARQWLGTHLLPVPEQRISMSVVHGDLEQWLAALRSWDRSALEDGEEEDDDFAATGFLPPGKIIEQEVEWEDTDAQSGAA